MRQQQKQQVIADQHVLRQQHKQQVMTDQHVFYVPSLQNQTKKFL